MGGFDPQLLYAPKFEPAWPDTGLIVASGLEQRGAGPGASGDGLINMHSSRVSRARNWWLGAAILGAGLMLLSQATAQDSPAQVLPLRLIVVSSQDGAQRIVDQLTGGADFAVLARLKSVDATAEDGGFMGDVDPTTLRQELRDALQGVQPGQFSRVVKLPTGFAILKVVAKSELAAMEAAQRTMQQALSAAQSVRNSFDISGLFEEESAWGAFPKPPDWNQDIQLMCSTRNQALAAAKENGAKYLASLTGANATSYDAMSKRLALGKLHVYSGEMDQAIRQWEIVYEMAPTYLPNAVSYLDELLGIGYLHKSQMENGVFRQPGDRCLFPPRASIAYTQPADSEKAIQHFLKYLDQKPDDIEVKWLLNVAYMTLGKYPNGVPKAYLLPPSLFESPEDIGRFVDRAPEAGLANFSMAGGVIVDDFENNGRFDVVTSSQDQCGAMHYFHNNGDGTFSDRTKAAGLSNQLGGLNIMQADYNNDGCMDILVLRGGWEIPQRKSLLRNNCDGTFTDVTREAGLAEPATATQTASWVDIDNDGFLDLFVGNENSPNQLFHNNGDGTFTDIAHSAGVDRVAYTKGVTAADYDHDGYVDLYLNNLQGTNSLYHNNHDLTFTDVAKQANVLGNGRGFATWFFDYDNDGWPDLFVTSFYMSVEETAKTYLGLPHFATGMKLYKNLGNGAFRDVTEETGLDKVFQPMGANFGDVDNDGYLDIYLGGGSPSYASLVPKVLLRNHDGKFFVDITASSGTGDLHRGHGIAFADLDNRGDEDIVAVIGGAEPGDSHALRLFENPGHGNDWISLKLVGVKANRCAIGARIKVTVNNAGRGTRSIYRTVGSGGSFGASPLEQHVGLGKSAQDVSVEILWPGDSTPQRFTNVDKNQAIEIHQFAHDYKKLVRPPVRLGGSHREPAAPVKASQSLNQ